MCQPASPLLASPRCCQNPEIIWHHNRYLWNITLSWFCWKTAWLGCILLCQKQLVVFHLHQESVLVTKHKHLQNDNKKISFPFLSRKSYLWHRSRSKSNKTICFLLLFTTMNNHNLIYKNWKMLDQDCTLKRRLSFQVWKGQFTF